MWLGERYAEMLSDNWGGAAAPMGAAAMRGELPAESGGAAGDSGATRRFFMCGNTVAMV